MRRNIRGAEVLREKPQQLVNTLGEKDMCDAEDIVRLMAPVEVVTTILWEDEMPTVSVISPLRAKLTRRFEATDEDTPLVAEMKKAFKNDFEKRYTHLEDLLYAASALDPRFKTLPFLSDDDDAERIFIGIPGEATALLNKVSQTNTPFH